jgi:hypothetical protein
MNDVFPIPENLPDAASVEGTFISLRRHEGDILAVLGAMRGDNMRIDAVDENTITLSWRAPFGMGPDSAITYQQIEPYLFKAISATPDPHHMARTMFNELYFVMENGQPVLMSSGIIDATIQTFEQSWTAIMGGIAILYISAAFFFVMSIAIFIGFLRRKGKWVNLFTHLNNGLLICGLLFAVNWVILDIRMMPIANISRSLLQSSMFTPHIWTNYILLVFSVVLFVASLVFWKKDAVSIKRRVLYSSTVAFLALSLFVLWQWNYFVMM